MKLDDIWAQLEYELFWRQEEIRLLSNTVGALARDADKDRVRRAQLVMLYAHTEGFSKIALSTYVKAINDLQLQCADVVPCIAASAFHDVFHAIRYGDPKGKVFNESLPHDEALHVFSRQRDFIAKVDSLLRRQVNVPDEAVDTESNLNSKVLRRNLFRLGFPLDRFADYESNLNELVYRRHGIAHGVDINAIPKGAYEKLQKAAFNFMDELTLSIVDAIETSQYLR